jgi:hypothetical protein
MSVDELAHLLERSRLSPEAIASAISGVLAKPTSLCKDPVWSLSNLTVEYGEPQIQTQGGNAGAAVGTVTRSVTFTPKPRATDFVAVGQHRLESPQVWDRAIRPHIGRAPRQACNSRSRGSRRQSGQDPGDPDPEPPDELVPALLGRSG